MENISNTSGIHCREMKQEEIADSKKENGLGENNTEILIGLLDAILIDWQRLDKAFFS